MFKNFMKGVVIGAVVYIVVLLSATALVDLYIEENGWALFIHKAPWLAERMITESGLYYSKNHKMEVVTFEDSKVNPDPNCYWEVPSVNAWIHFMY